jgi:NTP pyrophosphatase (non-canonical NTP hydrolase)
MKEMQDRIKQFNDVREWSDPACIKDLLLNMNEEIGEFWNLIKWVDVDKQQELIKGNKAEVENFIGDMLYLVFKVAYLSDVDSKKAIRDVMTEYEERFPIEKVKGSHANTRAGGFDLKQNKESKP